MAIITPELSPVRRLLRIYSAASIIDYWLIWLITG
jgi:hypothetical protein